MVMVRFGNDKVDLGRFRVAVCNPIVCYMECVWVCVRPYLVGVGRADMGVRHLSRVFEPFIKSAQSLLSCHERLAQALWFWQVHRLPKRAKTPHLESVLL